MIDSAALTVFSGEATASGLSVEVRGKGTGGIDTEPGARGQTLTVDGSVGRNTIVTRGDADDNPIYTGVPYSNAAAVRVLGGTLNMSHTTAETYGKGAPGVYLSAGTMTVGTGVDIKTHGDGAGGVVYTPLSGNTGGLTPTFDAGTTISTGGSNAHGFLADGYDHVTKTTDPFTLQFSTLGLDPGNISVAGSGSAAVAARNKATLILDGQNLGNLPPPPAGAYGAKAGPDGTVEFTNGAMTGGVALWAASGGTLDFNDDTSSASASVIQVDQNGVLDLSNRSTTLHAGQLESGGTSGGTVKLGGNRLNLDGTSAAQPVFGGIIQGSGGLTLSGAIQTLSGDNTYTGGTTISAGTLQLGNGGTSGSVVGDISNDGTLIFKRSDDVTYGNAITGSGAVTQAGSGTLTFTTDQTYTGMTTISGGTLQLGNGGTSGSVAGDIDNKSALVFKRSDDVSYGGVISGPGSVTQAGSGTLTFTADQTYTGTTTISSGTLQLGDGGTSGSVAGDITNDAALVFNRSNALTYAGVISGSGTITQAGSGTTTLTGNSGGFSGSTSVNAGTLKVNGTLGGAVNVASGGTLTGTGTVGGNTEIRNGGTLKGTHGDTLSVSGDLTLNGSSNVDVALGAPDATGLFSVGGDLTLDGTLNVTDHGGLSPGLYRLFDYSGNLTDNTLTIGSLPSGVDASDVQVQTDQPNQVNLLSSFGATLNYWDGGAAANEDNGAVDGGDGTWNLANRDWTEQDGSVNGPWSNDHFAIFSATAGTVTVDDSAGNIGIQGMQFAVDGYRIEGDAVSLDKDETIIRVGASGAGDTGITATVASRLTGSGKLKKTDGGTLVLTGNNTYSTWRDAGGQAAATHLYGIANLSYEMLDGTAAIDLAGTDFATENDRLWGGLGVGGSYSWADNKYALHGELALDTSLQNLAESYKVTGNVGIKVRW